MTNPEALSYVAAKLAIDSWKMLTAYSQLEKTQATANLNRKAAEALGCVESYDLHLKILTEGTMVQG